MDHLTMPTKFYCHVPTFIFVLILRYLSILMYHTCTMCCFYIANLQETKNKLKNLPDLKFSILHWHTKCLATKASRVP